MSSSLDIYDPNILVRLGHGIPHLDQAFHKVSNDFQQVNVNYEDYFISVSVLPAIISATIVVATIILQLILIIRCLCCRRPPKHKYDPVYECSQEALFDFLDASPVKSVISDPGAMDRCDVGCVTYYFYISRYIYRYYRAFLDCIKPCQCKQPAVKRQPMISEIFVVSFAHNNKKTFWFFIILVALAITANFSVFKSYDYFSESVGQSTDYVANIVTALNDIKYIGAEIAVTGSAMLNTLNNTDCEAAAGSDYYVMSDELNNLVYYSHDITDIVGSFPRKIDNTRTKFLDYADKKDVIIGIYFGVIMAVICGLFLSVCCQSKMFLNFGIFWGQLIILTLAIVAGCEMAATIILADFCYSPSENMLSVYPSGSDYDMISYYLQCSGPNPFNASLANVTSAIASLNQTVYDLKATTPAECSLISGLSNVTAYLSDLDDSLSCWTIFYNFNSAVNDAICNSFYNGVFVIFITHYILAGALFFVMVIVVAQFHYIIDAIGPEEEKATDISGEVEMVSEDVIIIEPHILSEEERRKDNEPPSVSPVKPARVLYWSDL